MNNWWTRSLNVFILAQVSIYNLHGTLVSLLSLKQNSASGKTLLNANGVDPMIAIQLIAKRRADTRIALGLFDWFSCKNYLRFDIQDGLLLKLRGFRESGFLLLPFWLLLGDLTTGGFDVLPGGSGLCT